MVAPGREADTVLVIDDDRGPRESLRMLLKDEYRVLCADRVDEGLRLLAAEHPDAVVMDIRMPGKDGITGLRELRDLDREVAVLMLTGHGSLDTAAEAIRHGAGDYLRKPFDTDHMLAVIRRSIDQTRLRRRRAAAESQLEQLQRRVDAPVASLDRMASLGLASSELVHDLRNPIAVVQGYVDLLSLELRERAAEDAAAPPGGPLEYLDRIQESLKRCTEMIEMWQSLGRGTRERATDVSLPALVRRVLDEARHLSASVDLQAVEGAAEPDLHVEGDALQLGRAIQNVVANSIQAVDPATGQVRVLCSPEGDAVVVDVRDNGCGIPPEHMDRLFDPFFTARRAGRGTGLGLFIAATVVRDHGGKVEVRSRPGAGTSVRIRLPRRRPAEEAPPARAAEA
jgi:signal transduction histidine kinase